LLDNDGKSHTQILGLSPDDPQGGRKMVEAVTKQHGAPPGFPLLADVAHKVIDRYGIFNPELFQGHIVPHPAVFVIDRSGKVTWKFLNTDARIRAKNEDISEALKRLENK
jgi:peroxiredoxin